MVAIQVVLCALGAIPLIASGMGVIVIAVAIIYGFLMGTINLFDRFQSWRFK